MFPTIIFAWGGENHIIISNNTYNILPEWEKNILGTYGDSLVSTYCLYPDMYRKKEFKKALAQYIEIPHVKDSAIFHVPNSYYGGNQKEEDSIPEFYILTYFMENAIKHLKANNIKEAARYMGVLAHFVEDYACPVHVIDNNTLRQLNPKPQHINEFNVHRDVEKHKMENFHISDHSVQKLGNNIFDTVHSIIPRFNKIQINSRAQAVPIILGFFNDEFDKSNQARINAAKPAAKLLADIWHTIFSIAFEKQ